MLPADGASMCRSAFLLPLLPGVSNSSVRCNSSLRTEMGRDSVWILISVMVCNVAPAFWCEFQPIVANCTASATRAALDLYLYQTEQQAESCGRKHTQIGKSWENTLKDATAPHTKHPLFSYSLAFREISGEMFFSWPQNPLVFGRFSELQVYIVMS